jgi:hypothetical protein
MSGVDVSPGPATVETPLGELEVSIVIPCLNEEAGIVHVVEQAKTALDAAGLAGEVLVVDNDSEDRSAELAREAGATVVFEPRRGYGSAYLAGVAAARGRYVVMADADGTYPLDLIGAFVEKLRGGADMVIGNRFGGTIHPGAMPWPNRYIGNPILTGMLNLLFGSRVSDAHCGLRALRRDVIPRLKLAAIGMEFASEMVIKAGKRRLRIEEIPIDYLPRIGESKLSRGRDAWRHVRFMLVHSPTFLFALPGGLATIGGLTGLVVLAVWNSLGEPWTGVAIAFAMLAIVGLGVIQLGLFARTYAVVYLGETDERLERGWRRFKLEHGLALSGVTLLAGTGIAAGSLFDGVPDPRLGLLGLTLMAIGSFFLSILGLSEHAVLRRKPSSRTLPAEAAAPRAIGVRSPVGGGGSRWTGSGERLGLSIVTEPELLYLDLLKRCVTRLAFEETHRPFSPGSRRGRAVAGLLRDRFGLELATAVAFDPQARAEGRDWPVDAETMIGLDRLNSLQECVTKVIREGVPGDLVETGVWRGGAVILMRAVLAAYGDTARAVWVADSFAGLPRPDEERYPLDAGDVYWQFDALAVSVDQVKANFARYGLLDDQVRFLPGWFRDTLPQAPIERIAVLRLDGDMYESTIVALDALHPKVSPGGFVIVDDYLSHPACKQASDDYRSAHGIDAPIEVVDHTAVLWRLPG